MYLLYQENDINWLLAQRSRYKNSIIFYLYLIQFKLGWIEFHESDIEIDQGEINSTQILGKKMVSTIRTYLWY